MAREKTNIEKKLSNLNSPLRDKIERKALDSLANEVWCRKHDISFEKGYNPWRHFGDVDYSDERERKAVEIIYQKIMKQEEKDLSRMYVRKFLEPHAPQNGDWYL